MRLMMTRVSILHLIVGLVLLTGCNSSPTPPPEAAHRSTGGRMPAGAPKYESFYVADQSTIKMVAARTISDKPLESFRGEESAPTEKAESADDNAETKKAKKGKADAEDEDASAAPKQKKPGGFWSKLGAKALTGAAARKSADKDKSTSDKSDSDEDDAAKKKPAEKPKRPTLGG